MPKRLSKKTEEAVPKKSDSKPIKKSQKAVKKEEVDKAVLANKDTVHYILILDDSGSMGGSGWS